MSAFEDSPIPPEIQGHCSCTACGNGIIQIKKYEIPHEADEGWDFDLECTNCSLEEMDYEPHEAIESTFYSGIDARVLAEFAQGGIKIRTVEELEKERKASAEDLCICPECNRDLVYPVEWEISSDTHWEVELRCPNCEWSKVDEFDQPTVDKLDEKLDIGTEILIRDLKRLQQSNRENEIEIFVRALGANAILPEDFGTPG
jgi:hypothetical protein